MRELGVFARYWTPGQVKTRLAAKIGATPAAEIYRASVAVMLNRFATAGDRRVVAFTPPDRYPEFAAVAGRYWVLRPQCEGSLGARMQNYFAEAFRDQAGQVVLLGSDSPTLPVEIVDAAFAHLQEYDVVLGPADDGGYYLIGMRRLVSGLFDGIAWSTDSVCEETRACLRALNVKWAELPPWYDFDEVSDVQRLRSELARRAPQETVFAPLLTAIGNALPLCH